MFGGVRDGAFWGAPGRFATVLGGAVYLSLKPPETLNSKPSG